MSTPVILTPMRTRLTLRVNTGLDEELKPIYRNRNWSNIKHDAADGDIFDIAHGIGELQDHTVSMIIKNAEAEIEEDDE